MPEKAWSQINLDKSLPFLTDATQACFEIHPLVHSLNDGKQLCWITSSQISLWIEGYESFIRGGDLKKMSVKESEIVFCPSKTCALTCVLLLNEERERRPHCCPPSEHYEPRQCQQQSVALVSYLCNRIHGQTSGGLKLIVFRWDKCGSHWKRHFSLTATLQLYPHSSVSNCKTNDNRICASQRLNFTMM